MNNAERIEAQKAVERFFVIVSNIPGHEKPAQTLQFHLDNIKAKEAILKCIAIDAEEVVAAVDGQDQGEAAINECPKSD